MSVPTVLFIIALILGVVQVARSRGYDLVAWAVVAVAVGLLWGNLT